MGGFVTSYRLVKDITAANSWRAGRRPTFTEPTQVVAYMRPLAELEDTEAAWAIALDFRKTLIGPGPMTLGRGSRDRLLIDPAKVLQAAAFHAATGVILVHNHPGGLAIASPGDDAVTEEVAHALLSARIVLEDHVVLAPDGYVSYRELGRLDHLLDREQGVRAALEAVRQM